MVFSFGYGEPFEFKYNKCIGSINEALIPVATVIAFKYNKCIGSIDIDGEPVCQANQFKYNKCIGSISSVKH